MIHPFRFRDSLLLQKLASQRVPLHLERHLIHPRWPLWTALGAPVPWHGSGVATYVYRPSSDTAWPPGFIQARKRLGRPEATLCYIAPALEASPQATDTWRALLEHLIAQAGDYGIHRLYACLPTAYEPASLIAASGFVPYVRETLFRLASPGRRKPAQMDETSVRGQREGDSLALQRLADRFTPQVVRQAEGHLFKDNGSNHALIFQAWRHSDQKAGLVYEHEGEVVAALFMHRGEQGIWLRYLGDPTRSEAIHGLLNRALLEMQGSEKPMYWGVRAYQSPVAVVLRERGFEEAMELTRLVKYTTVSLREPAPSKARILVETTTFPGVISTQLQSSGKKRRDQPHPPNLHESP